MAAVMVCLLCGDSLAIKNTFSNCAHQQSEDTRALTHTHHRARPLYLQNTHESKQH